MKAHDRVITILVVVLLFVPLALPYQFETGYWAESILAWIAYFLAGVILSLYVFFAFLQSWRRMMAETEVPDERSE